MKQLFSLSVALILCTAAVAGGPSVNVTGGSVAGTAEDGVQVFKGIPYAAPPVGDLRWAPPAEIVPWKGTRDASKFSPDCVQAPYDKSSVYYREPSPQSEDCLCLNVWSAAQKPDEKRPVMVWIHGGALTRGSGATPTYDGANFAKNGVVLVTINYRLGPFGFFSHPGLTAESKHDASGNQGVLDQIAALKWVQQNIAAFGGDPSRVTIFGESAGSWSVCSLMATPLSKGLFHRAIGESGGVFESMTYLKEEKRGRRSGEAVGLDFAKSLGAKDLAALRALPAQKIIEAFGPRASIPTRGVVDGWVFPKEARLVFASGEQHHVPVIVGSNANEMTTLTPRAMVPTTLDGLKQYVARDYKGFEAEFAAAYPAATDAEAGDAFLAASRDRGFTWQMRTWAREMTKAGVPAYLYFFSRIPPVGDHAYNRAFHAAEIAYAFGNLDMTRGYTDKDRELSAAMQGYWINFAKTGDPNGDGLIIWPAHDAQHDPYLELGDEIGSKQHLLKEQLDLVQKTMDARLATE